MANRQQRRIDRHTRHTPDPEPWNFVPPVARLLSDRTVRWTCTRHIPGQEHRYITVGTAINAEGKVCGVVHSGVFEPGSDDSPPSEAITRFLVPSAGEATVVSTQVNSVAVTGEEDVYAMTGTYTTTANLEVVLGFIFKGRLDQLSEEELYTTLSIGPTMTCPMSVAVGYPRGDETLVVVGDADTGDEAITQAFVYQMEHEGLTQVSMPVDESTMPFTTEQGVAYGGKNTWYIAGGCSMNHPGDLIQRQTVNGVMQPPGLSFLAVYDSDTREVTNYQLFAGSDLDIVSLFTDIAVQNGPIVPEQAGETFLADERLPKESHILVAHISKHFMAPAGEAMGSGLLQVVYKRTGPSSDMSFVANHTAHFSRKGYQVTALSSVGSWGGENSTRMALVGVAMNTVEGTTVSESYARIVSGFEAYTKRFVGWRV